MKTMRKTAIYLVFFFLLSGMLPPLTGFAQKQRIDSLKKEIVKSKPDTHRVKLLNRLAFSLRISDLSATQKYRREALDLSYRLKYPSGIAWGQYLEGVIFTYQNQLTRSINSLTVALDLAEKAQDHELTARIYNGIGLNNLRMEDDYNAMKAFENALTAIRKAKDRRFESALLHNVGALDVKNKRYGLAIKILGQLIAINKLRDDKTGLALNYKEMGLAFYGIQDYKNAILNAGKALILSQEIGFSLNEINSLSLLGAAYLKVNRLPEAKQYLDEAQKKALLVHPEREKLLIYQGYADYYAAEGNFKEALNFQNEYASLYDSLYNVGRSKLILEYQEKFKSQQKETENVLLRNRHLDTQQQIKQNNRMLIFISSILIMFMIFSGLIFWGNRQIKEANRLLAKQKDEIHAQKDNVDHINTIKDKLFSVIAYDLRSPFASMKSMMDRYDEGMISKDDVDSYFKELRKDIGSNTLLLDNLLIWAKSQLHGFKLHPKAIAMENVVDEIRYYYGKHLENKQIIFHNKLDESCIVSADYEMVKTVVRNLIGNAIKFTPAKGTISVSYVRKDGEIHIAITDSGAGLTEESKQKLFLDTFFTTQGLNNEKGTGLGLQICKEFVEKNGGKIWVDSREGEGSSFCFTLPGSEEKIDPIINNQDVEEEEKGTLKEQMNVARLQNKYDPYELLLKAINDTIWDWDLITNEITWSEALEINFGYSFEKTHMDWWLERVHPEDLQHTNDSINMAIKNRETIWEIEYRFRCADNSYKYVLDRGLIVFENDKAVRILGVMHNKDMNKNAIREIQRLSLVATNVNNLVVITNNDNEIVWVNRAFENFTGYSAMEVINEPLGKVFSGSRPGNLDIELMEKNMACKESFVTELVNYKKAGEPYWVQVNCTPYHDPITGQIGYISIHTVITERKENEKLMSKQNKSLREIARISSHEVRSPLSSILGLVKIIQNNSDPAERSECISLLDQSAGQLDILIHRINNHLREIAKQEYKMPD